MFFYCCWGTCAINICFDLFWSFSFLSFPVCFLNHFTSLTYLIQIKVVSRGAFSIVKIRENYDDSFQVQPTLYNWGEVSDNPGHGGACILLYIWTMSRKVGSSAGTAPTFLCFLLFLFDIFDVYQVKILRIYWNWWQVCTAEEHLCIIASNLHLCKPVLIVIGWDFNSQFIGYCLQFMSHIWSFSSE